MHLTKKRELIYNENTFFGWKIGYSLGTIYRKSIHNIDTIELWNFGYCPSIKEFYYTRNIRLSKEIINYFQGASYNEYNIAQMEKLGIYNGDKVEKIINKYEKQKKEIEFLKRQMDLEKQNVLNFKKTLRKKK